MGSEIAVEVSSVYCVIVTYRPNLANLVRVIREIGSDVSVVVVSNADQSPLSVEIERECDKLPCKCISLGRNAGIGFAQNVGIRHSLESGADYIFLLDDDSEPTTDCVTTLLQDDLALRKAGA